MVLDPSARSRECNPYSVLARVGIVPDSTLQVIQDASYALMAQGDTNDAWREAWDELRIVPRRLIIDFFLYGSLLGE